jgi:TRAP-type C4-dicarboxylate transport system permease small subunit
MKPILRKGFDRLATTVRFTVVLLAVIMLIALSLQVVMRFSIGQALSWSEELALACFSWCMLLAIALGVRDHIHVRMDLLTDHFPHSVQVGLDKLIGAVITGLGLFLAWSGTNYVQDAFGSTSAAIGYPTAYLYGCAPVCGVLVAIFALEIVLIGPAPKAIVAEDSSIAQAQ